LDRGPEVVNLSEPQRGQNLKTSVGWFSEFIYCVLFKAFVAFENWFIKSTVVNEKSQE